LRKESLIRRQPLGGRAALVELLLGDPGEDEVRLPPLVSRHLGLAIPDVAGRRVATIEVALGQRLPRLAQIGAHDATLRIR
jgi:hypothetical protein